MRAVTVSVLVFTRDLRLADNPAVTAAAQAGAVVPLFVWDEAILSQTGGQAGRLGFLLDSLRDLDASLRGAGGSLVTRAGPWVGTVLATARAAGAGRIHLAADVSGYAGRRLASLRRAAAGTGIAVVPHPGITVVDPAALRAPGGGPYQVFSPYYRRWLAAPWRRVLPAPARITLPQALADGGPADGGLADWGLGDAGLGNGSSAAGRLPPLAGLAATPRPAGALPGGELAGLARMARWSAGQLAHYDRCHDDLAADATSRLSAYLHFGCVSPLVLATEMRDRPGGAAFVRQVAWRDFFCQLLAARPDAARQDYRDRGGDWRDDPDGLGAWQQGRTGYPVVDAAMRQLTREGFMHNRSRMIVASFLTKDLRIDWRAGAAHFMRHLVDADVACNQLNWQWVAGTGTDPNRYRVFNPARQGRRFDPDGAYVRRYLPELAGLPAEQIHDPDPATRRQRRYPEPIVDHHKAIAAYREGRRRA